MFFIDVKAIFDKVICYFIYQLAYFGNNFSFPYIEMSLFLF